MNIPIDKEQASPGLEKFQSIFLQDRLAECLILHSNLRENEFEEIRKIAHKWKGFCSPYGFHHLGDLSELLLQNALKKEANEIHEILVNIDQYLSEKRKLLNI